MRRKRRNFHKKGMRYPPLNQLISKAHNKYELVLAASKRAREIVDGKDPLIPVTIDNAISIATDEIANDYVMLHNDSLEPHRWEHNPHSLVPISTDNHIVEVENENSLVEVEDS